MLNRFALYLAGFLLFFSFGSYSLASEYVDRIVAAVNDDVITLSELEAAGGQIFAGIRKQALAGEVEKALHDARSGVLSSMIDNIIVRQEAQTLGIKVEESEIDMAITEMLARVNASYAEFKKELASMNVTEKDYRDNLRDQILKTKLIGFQVSSRIVITEEDMKKYYENDYPQGDKGDGYYILQMGFKWKKPEAFGSESSLKDVTEKRAKEIRARVLEGESFKDLARSYSDLPSAADGGDIGRIGKDEMGPSMREAILATEPGGLSQVIETSDTFQFFKLLAVRQGEKVLKAPYESVKDDIRDLLYGREMEEEYNAWVKSLRSQAYIRVQL